MVHMSYKNKYIFVFFGDSSTLLFPHFRPQYPSWLTEKNENCWENFSLLPLMKFSI